jgi:molybdopterin synthase sulfur carrier subunit
LIFKKGPKDLKITVRFYGVAYEKTGIREWNPELPQGVKIMDLLKKMTKEYPKISSLVFDEKGAPIEYLSVSVNNVDILGLEGFETALHDGDTVLIMPPIGGG